MPSDWAVRRDCGAQAPEIQGYSPASGSHLPRVTLPLLMNYCGCTANLDSVRPEEWPDSLRSLDGCVIRARRAQARQLTLCETLNAGDRERSSAKDNASPRAISFSEPFQKIGQRKGEASIAGLHRKSYDGNKLVYH
jgi:hypothetical protein